ncbi:MAG: exopolyphosphatase [Hydrogenophilales bacterium]|nr:exopolyphosphatase [Hydrogenophilales bacterium]
MPAHDTIAAVDLGSNSFRLQITRIIDDQIYPLDSLKESVRLASGLTDDNQLDPAAQERALACLRRFNERLRDLPREAVRVVGTNTFRVAKNARAFIRAAEDALGFPIDIIAGHEEARLIYLGVSRGLPISAAKRLVVDIGGGSTEFIIGQGFDPLEMESLYMGCVSFSQRFFPDGKIGKGALQKAELAARAQVQVIASRFAAGAWQEAIGSSGTARALADIMQQNGWSDGGITARGIEKLRALLVKAGEVKALTLPGLQGDRIPVLPGGFSIMAGIFAELDIEQMAVTGGALREGVLLDLLGRFHHHDQRDATVTQFMRRYHVDAAQAARVEALALVLFDQVAAHITQDAESARRLLIWAARLHEVGITIAHAGYHKHSAYILGNADMPGFSKIDQARLSRLARTHRGGLAKAVKEQAIEEESWELIAILRLAVLLCRNRRDPDHDALCYQRDGSTLRLIIDPQWLAGSPLTETLLEDEIQQWKAVGGSLAVEYRQARQKTG